MASYSFKRYAVSIQILPLDMSYSLNSLKGDYIGDYYRGDSGDIRSLGYGPHKLHTFHRGCVAKAVPMVAIETVRMQVLNNFMA